MNRENYGYEQQQNMINQEYFDQMQRNNAVRLEEEDTNKWEIDTKTIIDEFCRGLLGEVEDAEGNWVRDYNKIRRMNERGMSAFKSELNARMSKIMLLSELDEVDVRVHCKIIGKNFSDMIADNWQDWEIKPEHSNMQDITDQLVQFMEYGFKSAKRGGMRKHRERSKFPVAFSGGYQGTGGVM